MKTEKIDHKIKIKLVVMIIIISGIVILGINFAPWIIEKVKKPEALREYLRSLAA